MMSKKFTDSMMSNNFSDSWWFWFVCVLATLAYGLLSHWDWLSWYLIGYFVFTGIVRIVVHRRKSKETAAAKHTSSPAP
jgi:membrane protease YdiL (CAAX protease family)